MEKGPGFLKGISLETLQSAYNKPDSQLSEEEAASTLFRFFRSDHVVDLRLIVITILGLLGFYIIILIVGLVEFSLDNQKDSKLDLAFKLIGPAAGIAGLIISWAYKAASTRLGVIDLFGCEIGTLCRVGTILDIGTYYIREYEGRAGVKDDWAEKRDAFNKFSSQENYFPIFDNNSSDLKLLEALVVCRITEFYTYMKASRDTRRLLATIPSPKEMHLPQEAAAGAQKTPRQAVILNVVYMIFLGYEAARKAIDYLVEFEPTAAANKLSIMITELTCYGFLLSNLKDDHLRYPRLQLRRKTYMNDTPTLYREIDKNHGEHDKYWCPSRELLSQLGVRYESALGEKMVDALARLAAEEAATGHAAAF